MAALCHEPFYRTGTWIDESIGLYAGWVARDDALPRTVPFGDDGEVLAIFGEEYSRTLRDPRLTALNGRFHGLLLDRARRTATIFNDRYGLQRLYVHESKDAFYFAAEAKAILAVRPELRKTDPRGLGEFVACGAVLENRTVFEGIHVLPPASAWLFRNGSLERKRSYFQPKEWEEQEKLDPEAYYRELRTAFTRSLTRYFNGHLRIAMSLTGGLDTRMILACRKPDPGSLPCYTFGSMLRENQDVRVARRVAEICNQSHQIITVGQEFLLQFPRYAERAVYLTDGCVDVGRAPDLYLNERAREIAPVRMTGNYGGEILRGVRSFKPVEPVTGLFCSEFLSHVHQAGEAYTRIASGHPVSFAAFRQSPWYHYGVLALEQTQVSMRSPFLDNDFVRTVFRSPASALASHEVSLRLIADGNRSLLRIPTDRGLAGNRGFVLGATSRGLLEFLFKAEYAYDMGMPHWLARLDHALSPLRLEHMFLGRHKVFHFRVWYRDALASYVKETLLDPRSLSRPYLERNGLEAIVRGHLKGDQNYTNELHKVLTLELVHRIFLENQGRSGERRVPETPLTAAQVT